MKRLLIIGLVVVVAIVALAAAVPFIVSSDAVKHRIADQITNWTGRDVAFSGDPRISLFPYLSVRLRDVTIANPTGFDGEPFVRMESLTGKLEILPLLLGRIEVAEFRLTNPRFNFMIGRDGAANWHLNQGAVGAQVAKGDSEVISTEIAPPSPLADISLGRFFVRNGRATFTDLRNGRSETIDKAALDLRWPSTAEAISGTGSFTWHDEPVDFNGSVDAPLALIAGGASPVRLGLASNMLKASFSGRAAELDGIQIDGDAKLATPSVRRLVGWLGVPLGPGAILGAGTIAGKMNLVDSTISFSDAQMELDGNLAVGVASLSFADARPLLQGTLALDNLDLTAYLDAFRAEIANGDLPRHMLAVLPDLDLRISTDQLVLGAAKSGRAAGAAELKDGKLTLTLGEAQFYAGTVEGKLTAEETSAGVNATFQANLDEIPARVALSDLFGVSALDGVGAVNLDLATNGANWSDLAQHLAGSASVTVTDGSLDGFTVEEMPKLIAGARPSAGASTLFTTASATLRVADGTIATDDFNAEGDDYKVQMSGKTSPFDRSIQGRGVVTFSSADANGAAEANEVPFLLTGSWSVPTFLPDLGRPIQPDPSQSGKAEAAQTPG